MGVAVSLRTVGVAGCGDDSGIGNQIHFGFHIDAEQTAALQWNFHQFFQPARYQQQKTCNWNFLEHLIFLGVPPWKKNLFFLWFKKKLRIPPPGIGPSSGTGTGTCSNWVLNSKISFFKSRTKASCCCDRDRSSDVMSPVQCWEMVVLGGGKPSLSCILTQLAAWKLSHPVFSRLEMQIAEQNSGVHGFLASYVKVDPGVSCSEV